MKRNAVTVNPLTVTPGSDDDDSNTTNPLMTNYPADDHDVEDSGAPLPSQHRRGSICAYVAIFLAGCALAAAVVGYGIQESRSDADRQFDLEAVDLVNAFESSWNQYRTAALWAYQSGNSSGLFEREDFYETSRNLQSLGLVYEQIGFCIHLRHEDRAEYEAKAKASYAELFPQMPYFGLMAFNIDPSSPFGFNISIREEREFYYPCPYQVFPNEPRFEFVRAVDLQAGPNVDIEDSLLEPGEPFLSNTLSITNPSVPNETIRFVTMMHPGRGQSFNLSMSSIATITIRPDKMVTALLEGARLSEPRSIYVFETSKGTNINGFNLLGIQQSLDPVDEFLVGARGSPTSGGSDATVEPLVNATIDSVRNVERRRKLESVLRIGNRNWTVIVLSDDDGIDGNLGFVLLTAGMIVLVSCVLMVWLRSVRKRRESLEAIHRQAADEKTALIIQNAKTKAENERELNDFIAHEVRNPLAAAMSACTFVSSSLEDKQAMTTDRGRNAAKEDVAIIDLSLHYINDLLRDMLDLHRATNGQMKLKETETSVLHDVLTPVSNMLYNRGPSIKVVVDCPENLLIMVDRIRLTQIVLNIGRNSLKFVRTGFIRFRAYVEEQSGEALISVEDSGPGIPESKRNKLFQKFQESLDSLNQGTGIGLAVCRKLIDIMEGDIVLDETYQSGIEGCPGARFVIHTNRQQIKMDEVEVETSSDAGERGSKEEELALHDEADVASNLICEVDAKETLPDSCSVLFTDDDTLLRRLFSRSLAQVMPNWTIQHASNGESAIELATKQEFDIIFMDQYMTSTTKQLLGTETVRLMRARGVKSIISGLSANDMRFAFQEAGADTFVLKPLPCKSDALLATLRSVWASRRVETGEAATVQL